MAESTESRRPEWWEVVVVPLFLAGLQVARGASPYTLNCRIGSAGSSSLMLLLEKQEQRRATKLEKPIVTNAVLMSIRVWLECKGIISRHTRRRDGAGGSLLKLIFDF